MDDVCTIVGRIGFRGYTKADLVNSSKDGAITLSPSNIINGELDFSKCTYINWDKYYESPEIMLENGDIVLVKTASIGKCAVVKNLPHESTLNPQFVVLKHLVGVPDFICYYLKSSIAQNTIKQMAGGVAIPTLSQKKLGMMIVPTPSQDEQQSIVDYLDSAFAKIDAMKANAEKALNEAKALFQASLKEMLEPKEGWEEKKLGEICTFSQGVQVPLQNQSLKESAGYTRFLRIIDFTQGSEPPRYVPINDAKYWMNHEDIAIVRYGASTGFICTGLEGTLANNLFRLNIKCDVSPHYLIYVLKSEIFQSVIKVQMNGAAMPAISFGLIEGIKMPIPSHSEQQSIATTLDSLKSKVDRLQENYDKISQECDALKQAILRQVFE